jgi:polyisoprenoid-binding protein YceI
VALFEAVLLQAIAVTGAFAQPISIDLDPAKTKIEFVIGDVLHTVRGKFKLKSGHIDVNPQTKTISGQIVVDASSGESGSGARDRRMKQSILEADRYPDITFTPSTIEGDLSTRPSSVTVSGWFDIHGQRHRLSIPVQVTMPGDKAVAIGNFVVPYVAWGMKNPSTLFLRVNQEVGINVTAVGCIAGYVKGAR